MELLAIYINNHFLYKEPIYLNFGGKYIFKFENKEEKLIITKSNNENYLDDFFKKGITNISTIVGNNGVGKTSIMRCLDNNLNCLSLYIKDDLLYIQNQTKNIINCSFDYNELFEKRRPIPLYYSSIIDYNLIDFESPISESNRIKESLTEYHYDTILRQIFFINNKGQYLKIKHPELPTYDNVTISINNPLKSQFLNPEFYKKATVGKSIKKQMELLWEHYNTNDSEMLHKNEGFLKNLEIFILSIFVGDDMYIQTNDNGKSIGFQDVLEQLSFENKLELFLKKRLDNIDSPLYKGLEMSIGITFDKTEELINNIKENSISKIAGGFNYNSIKENAIHIILRYSNVFKLYTFLKKNEKKFQNPDKTSELILRVNKANTEEILKELFKLIHGVYESFKDLMFEFRVFNVSPARKMSTGEQSILNLYSSIYSFVSSNKEQKKTFILLLDEPEQGYHAVWKKKFIWTLNETLPELFSELKQKTSVQVIFTTHDALTLSDLPNDKISYLKRFDDKKIKVFHVGDSERPTKSFGANITDLLADSFFVDDGLIGDFAKNKINEVLNNLNFQILSKELKELRGSSDIAAEELFKSKQEQYRKLEGKFVYREKQYLYALIGIVDEPILKHKLKEMFLLSFPEEIDKNEAIRRAKEILGNAGLKFEDLTPES
jgi:hypothetical protein